MPKVSVVVAAYNAEPFIQHTVESVLAQTVTDFEVIVVDDGSRDRTVPIVNELASRDPRVCLLRHNDNQGVGAARNSGICRATGKWITILDADDWYEPARLETLIREVERHNAVLAADNQFIHEGYADTPWCHLRKRGVDGQTARVSADDFIRGDRCGRFGNLGLLKPIVRKDFLRKHKIKYDEHYGLGEDFYFILDCLKYTPSLIFVKRPLYHYRIHEGSRSGQLDVALFTGMLAMHERHAALFDLHETPTTVGLLARRRLQLTEYIRSQHVAIPLRNHQYFETLRRAYADPRAALNLVSRTMSYILRKARKSLARTRLSSASLSVAGTKAQRHKKCVSKDQAAL